MKKSGIYIVQLKNEVPMPVTRDPRYVEFWVQINSGWAVGDESVYCGDITVWDL